MLATTLPQVLAPEFACDVRAGLSKAGQRELPSKYLYDDVGSELFEAICLLPEYGLTRADARLLQRYSGELFEHVPLPTHVAELGSGSGKKTRHILEAISRCQRTFYYPIEISAAALAACEKELGQMDFVSLVGYEKPYLEGLRAVAARRKQGEHLCVLFLGSTIGNFDRPAADDFLRQVRGALEPGDSLILGTDLVKDVATQILAYDDPIGVTAAFNLNLLARINRELGGNFQLREFQHVARWNAEERRIEMHLRSRRRQRVSIAAANLLLRLEEGETIWTESSHKYEAAEPPRMAQRAGFRQVKQWIDGEWAFAQNLWLAE
ncbi:MAG TPA: L-histidine N(alpha)-methyltransferase [Dongiaceae bacterium]|nr:L-histidine N(alpha)-methyltransferase [Dongiaceae bacterium]